jgi:hypothetical protein
MRTRMRRRTRGGRVRRRLGGRGSAMKQRLCVVSAITAIVLVLSTTTSAAQPTPPVFEDSAVGGATILAQFRGVAFDAHSGPNGENPHGQASAAVRSTYSVSGHVTCLRVAGNRATIGFAVDDGFTIFENRGHLIFVEDNGSPGAGQDLANDRPVSDPPTVCPPTTDEDLVPFPFIPIRPQPIQSGEITVHDAVVPTSQEQCKHGGSQALGFKNQGQCIAFVAHQP